MHQTAKIQFVLRIKCNANVKSWLLKTEHAIKEENINNIAELMNIKSEKKKKKSESEEVVLLWLLYSVQTQIWSICT